jgi:tRNA(Arg) A34 adenosine deaminase TadA
MSRLTPGVTRGEGTIESAAQAAVKVVELSRQAVQAGTFGVGGFLMDRAGRVLAEATNAVIHDGEVRDPTAHVERQLVDWYFESRARGMAVGEARDLIIVSSLDPCAMCAGAILRAGMNVVALAEDPVSGVHADGCPHRMPSELWPQAERSMGLFDTSGRSGHVEHISSILAGRVSADLLRMSELSFQQSLDTVREKIAAVAPDERESSWSVGPTVLAALGGLTAELSDNVRVPRDVIRFPGASAARLVSPLLAGDGSVLVDAAGSVIIGAATRVELSPARSSVLELIRAYVELRKAAKTRLGMTLPHQRVCSLIKLEARSHPATALLEFGALGSFLEQEHLGRRFPAFGFLEPEQDHKAERFLSSLPPLYNSIIGLDVGEVSGRFAQPAGP